MLILMGAAGKRRRQSHDDPAFFEIYAK